MTAKTIMIKTEDKYVVRGQWLKSIIAFKINFEKYAYKSYVVRGHGLVPVDFVHIIHGYCPGAKYTPGHQ